VPPDEPQKSTNDRYGDNEDEQSQVNVSTINKQEKQDSKVSKKRDQDKKKKKKKKSKSDKEKRKSTSSSSKLVDRVPTVESCESVKTQAIEGEKLQDDARDLIASDDDGDDRYSVAGHLSRGGRSSTGVSVLSDDSDEYGARWRSWDDDEDVEFRDNSPVTDDEMATTDNERKKDKKKKKKKKHRSKSKDKSSKKKKKSKSKKSKQSEDDVRDQPEDHENSPVIKDSEKPTPTASDSLIQVLGATISDGQDHALIEEVEIEHISNNPVEIGVTENIAKNAVESFEEEVVGSIDKEALPYTKSIIPDDTFEVDNDDGVVDVFTTNKKELLELDEYSVHDVENHSALGQCLRFYSCNGIARLLEFQPKLLPPIVKKETNEVRTASTNQNFELLLGVKSPVATDPPENIIVPGNSEDSFDVLHEAPSLDTIKKNPSVVVDLTGKNLCLDDESLEDQPSKMSGRGQRHRKRTPRSNHKVTVTSIEIPESKLKKGKKSARASSATDSDKSDKTLQVRNKKAPKRGLWRKRRPLDSDDKSGSSARSAASSRASISTIKKRSVQSFFLRVQGKRAQC
jgi:hypothetical protein